MILSVFIYLFCAYALPSSFLPFYLEEVHPILCIVQLTISAENDILEIEVSKAVSAVKKPKRKIINNIVLIPVAILSPVVIIIALFFGLLGAVYIHSQIERYQIRSEIFSYVLENAATIELDSSNSHQEFFYTATGLQDGGVEYGYYFTPDDDHLLHGEPYRRGYRTYGTPDDDTDWYYSERICKNWFYYEVHDG